MQFFIGLFFDTRDTFEQCLEKLDVRIRTWFDFTRFVAVIHWKTFTFIRQRVVVQVALHVRLDIGAESAQLRIAEEAAQHGTSAVRRPADQPALAEAVAVDPEACRYNRALTQHLEHQRTAERRDGLSDPIDAGGQGRGIAVGRAADHPGVVRQAEPRGG